MQRLFSEVQDDALLPLLCSINLHYVSLGLRDIIVNNAVYICAEMRQRQKWKGPGVGVGGMGVVTGSREEH